MNESSEEWELRELNSSGECFAKTTNACPTLGHPAYTHLIRIYATNTCINYIKNEFITTPALATPPIFPARSFPIRIRFLSSTAASRFLLEYLFAFHSDFDTPFSLLIITYTVVEWPAAWTNMEPGCDGVVAV